MMRYSRTHPNGFTLIEVLVVIVIIGVLVGVAVQNGGELYQTARIEETKEEMDALALAVAGNPKVENGGVRSDFGYVGDVGAMPPDLDALYTNPGGYTTWNGPYIGNRFTQTGDDYKKDAFGAEYVYTGGATITSTGSGSNIVRRLATSVSDLLYNSFSGNVYDLDGTPPGHVYADSVVVRITYPNGTGGTTTRGVTTDAGGYFSFDSLPLGNHDLEIIYESDYDTLHRTVAIDVSSAAHVEYRFSSNFWYASTATGGGLEQVAGSDSLTSDCRGFYFYISNSSGGSIDISSLTVAFTAPTAYYRYVRWGGMTVFDQSNPKSGSGDVSIFGSVQIIADGATIRVDVDGFKTNPSGGANVDVDNSTFTITFSDGSSFDVNTGACP